tara:strand:- start:1643 stop:3067 length:1425 start_codon:yes stop_codon:yes gene_type:complete
MEQVADDFESSATIIWAQPNYIYTLQGSPNDTYYLGYQWNMRMIQFDDIFPNITGNSDVIITVIDSGIDLDHPDLVEAIWTNANEIPNNSIDDDNNGYVDDIYGWNFINDTNDIDDDNNHGTHVAGIAVAKANNQLGIAGVCSGCTVMSLKAADQNGDLTSTSISNALSYAIDNGSSIINLSFGAHQAYVSQEMLIKNSIDIALANNCLVIAAAGNFAQNIDTNPFIPASYDGVIAVAAVNESGLFADNYSNYGNRIDISAPGGSGIGDSEQDIFSTFPNSTYDFLHGTSMAAPHIAGIIGLLVSVYPDISPTDVKDTLFNSANDLGDSGKDDFYGYGLLAVKNAITYLDSNVLIQDITVSTTLKVFGPNGENSSILNGPNPFNPIQEATFIQYELSKDATVELHIHSISGEKVWSRYFGLGDVSGSSTGFHSVEWSGKNNFGNYVASGPYLIYLVANSDGETVIETTKILVLK